MAEIRVRIAQVSDLHINRKNDRSKATSTKPEPSLAAAQKCAAAKQKLLALTLASTPGAQTKWSRARAILDSLAQAIASTVPTGESLRIGVMVFDETSNRLRTACSNTEPEGLPPGEFASGEGCAGFVFEKTRTLLYHEARDPIGYFIRPDERLGGARMEEAVVLASFPWIYSSGADQLLVLGVVNICSFDRGTELLTLFDLPKDKFILKMKEMHELVNLACAQLFII